MLFGTRETFAYRRCLTCGVMWLVAPPPDLGRYYPPEYHATPPAVAKEPAPRSVLGRRLGDLLAARALFGTHRIGARLARLLGQSLDPEVTAVRWLVRQTELRSLDDPILDVGSGPVPERLVLLSRAHFRNLRGIDPLIPADVVYDGIPVLRQEIADVSGHYSFITLHHSFEHMPDPAAAMRLLARLLDANGTLMIRTPVMGTWFWRKYGLNWWELDPPRHLFVHTPRSLEILAANAGLRLARAAYDSSYIEILASDQIARDVAWREPGSWWADAPGAFDEAEIAAARATASRLNEAGDAGRAAFFFRHSEGAG
jgi:SAM-dependent methyltransferase